MDLTARKLDAQALKAFAHPVRIRLYELLEEYGAATATQLAARIGENTGVTSYHLRQLARHGLIEDVPERGKGKERWWRAAGFSADLLTALEDPETASAAEVLLAKLVQQRHDEFSSWTREARTMAPEWVATSMQSRWTVRATRQELEELNARVMTMINEFTDARRDRVNPDTVRVQLYYDALPRAVPPDSSS